MTHAFTDERGSQAAVAAEALAHARVLEGLALGNRNSVVPPAEGAIGNPATLSVGGSHPNLNAGFSVFDMQRPFSFQFGDFVVTNDDCLEWVDDNKVVLSKNQLWPDPEQVGRDGHKCCDYEVDYQGFSWVENSLNHENGIHDEGHTGPDEVTLWSKDCIHGSIIAGVTAVGKGK